MSGQAGVPLPAPRCQTAGSVNSELPWCAASPCDPPAGAGATDDRYRAPPRGTAWLDYVLLLVLGGGAPVYKREYKEPAYYAESKKFKIEDVKEPTDYKTVMNHLISHPNIASKRWVYNQYDSMVGTINQSTNNPSDAAIVNVKGTKKALALSVDCNSRYVNADPEIGYAIAVGEAPEILFAAAVSPSAVTNCQILAIPTTLKFIGSF